MRDAAVAILALLGCSCAAPSAPVCADIPSPFPPVVLGAPQELSEGGIVINLAACEGTSWLDWLPFGSALVTVHAEGDECELWIGGETEDPMYDSSPTQYCRFASRGSVDIVVGDRGPAHLESACCAF